MDGTSRHYLPLETQGFNRVTATVDSYPSPERNKGKYVIFTFLVIMDDNKLVHDKIVMKLPWIIHTACSFLLLL